MSDEVRVRKDGRPLIFEHPISWEDEIEPLPVELERDMRATACRGSREPKFEAWMGDV